MEGKIGLYYKELNEEFFSDVVQKIYPGAKFVKWVETNQGPKSSEGVVTSFLQRDDHRIIGIRTIRIHYEFVSSDGTAVEATKDVAIKSRKGTAEMQKDILGFFTMIDPEFGPDLAAAMKQMFDKGFMQDLTLKELESISQTSPLWAAILPDVYKLVKDDKHQIYAFVVDNYAAPENGYTHFNKGETPEAWTHDDVIETFQQLANFHGQYLGRLDKLPPKLAKLVIPATKQAPGEEFIKSLELKHKIIMKHRSQYVSPIHAKIYPNLLENIGRILGVLARGPHSLIHNDFTIRNMCKRPNPAPGKSTICIYDWEELKVFPPQHDAVEFLVLWLPDDANIDTYYKYLEIYRKLLIEAVESQNEAVAPEVKSGLEKDAFMEMCDMCFLEMFLNRFQFAMCATIIIPMPIIDRIVSISDTILQHISETYDFLKC